MSTLLTGDGSPAPSAGGAGDLVIDTTTQTFAADVIEASMQQPVLVDFWAPWCGPCRTLGPIIEKAVRASKGAVKLVKMNIDEHPAVAGQLGIQSIPAVIAFSKGQPVDGFVGAVPESQVKEFIERVAGPVGPSDSEALVASGEELLAAGDTAGAAECFAAVLAAEPQSVPAAAGLARCLVVDRRTRSRPPDPRPAAGIGGRRSEGGRRARAARPGDADRRTRRRIGAGGEGRRRSGAIFRRASTWRFCATKRAIAKVRPIELLEIMAKNRSWEDEKARKQLLPVLRGLGARRTKRRLPDAAACRRCCFPEDLREGW